MGFGNPSATQAQRTSSTSSNVQGQVDVGILPNDLDNYENPTYHWRLYMMGSGAVLARNFSNNANSERIVIAESGVSPIDIDDVEIRTTGGITKDAGVGQATNFSFTLREPFGVTLLDQIQRAGYYLEIDNFQKFPMYLELSFVGRRPVENDDLSGENMPDDPLKGMVWTWPIQLTNMAMNVTTGGTVYALQAAAYGDYAYTNQASDIEKAVNITTDTVGDFFTQLQDQLNKREIEKEQSSGYQGTTTDKYNFWIDEEIYNAKIVPDTLDERDNRAATYNEEDGKMTFSFQPGISIEKIVYNVLSLTRFYHKQVNSSEDPDSAGQARQQEEAIYQKLWRIIADTDVGLYDKVRQDYQRIYKYLIIPYEMTTIQNVENITANVSDADRLRAHRRKGLVRKLYNYIYTGLNDQVFDFELNFNFNWFIALPLQGGITTIASRQEPKGKLTPEQKERTDVWAKKVDDFSKFLANPPGFAPLSQLEDWLNGNINSLTSSITPAVNQINAASASVNDVIGNANAAAQSALDTVQSGMPVVPDPISGIVQNPATPFISGASTTLNVLTDLTRVPRISTPSANVPTPDKAQKNLRSIDFQLDHPDIIEAANQKIRTAIAETKTRESDGQDFAAKPGQTLLSAMFEQAESPVAGDLLNLELRIKGDPYWLEPSPNKLGRPPLTQFRRLMANRGEDGDAVQTATSVQTNLSESDQLTVANTAERQTLMVFRSFTPQEFDPETGLTPAGRENSNVLNGIYAVREVVHNFSGGEFTQTLYACRDTQINLRNVDLFEELNDQPEDSGSDSTNPQTDIETWEVAQGAAGILDATSTLTNQTQQRINTVANLINPNNTFSSGSAGTIGPVNTSVLSSINANPIGTNGPRITPISVSSIGVTVPEGGSTTTGRSSSGTGRRYRGNRFSRRYAQSRYDGSFDRTRTDRE